MFDIYLRNLKDRMIDPFSSFVPAWLSPNFLTLVAFLSGLASCWSTSRSSSNWAVVFWLVNRFFDCLDGSVARRRKKTTQLGGFLDLLGDFIIYSAIPVSIAIGRDRREWQDFGSQYELSVPRWQAVAVLECTFHINNFVLFYTAAVSSKLRSGELTSISMQPAVIEGFESGIFFTAMLLFPKHLTLLSWIMAGAVLVGTAQRVMKLAAAFGKLETV